jgi:hypothetical protein
MKLLIMQFPPISRHIIPRRSKYSPQHPVLSNTLSLCSSLNVRDQVPHPYGRKSNGELIVVSFAAFRCKRVKQ